MPQIPFVGASYRERPRNLDAQACINLYPVMGESGASKSPAALYGTPGTRPFITLPDGPVRALYRPTDGSSLIVVAGARVYRMTADGVTKIVGGIDNAPNLVSITDNGTQAVLVTGSSGYILDLGTGVMTEISDPAFYGADFADILDTYAIFNRPGTNQFYISGSNDITFDALDFASAETNFEPIVRHIVSHSELVIFKRTVTEIWRVSGDPDFPLAKDTNASIEQGCAAPWSVVKMDNSVFWLGQGEGGGGIVWRLNGYTPVRVSTDAIEYAIASYGDVSDALAYSYVQEGQTFYMLTFPSAGATWCYDAATQMWHQRAYLDPNTGTLGRHRSNCHAYFAGMHLVGDYSTGTLYQLDLDYHYDGTDPMPAIRAAAHVADPDYQWIIHHCLQLDMETGNGDQTGQGAAPVVLLDWSDNNGRTWSNQHPASLGPVGQYQRRVRWMRLGRARARVYRITITDPVPRSIIGASLNPEG